MVDKDDDHPIHEAKNGGVPYVPENPQVSMVVNLW